MITPTRFGLKYAPVPTLALEYEVELSNVDDDGRGTTSLYVYDHTSVATARRTQRVKKLHVVELPALAKQSELAAVARQLQQDNQRFLAPDVVKEDQLLRLLERLVAHAQVSELSVSSAARGGSGEDLGRTTGTAATSDGGGAFESHDDDGRQHDSGDDEKEANGSDMDESVADRSAVSVDAASNRFEGRTSNASGDDDEDSGGGRSAFQVVGAAETSSSIGALKASHDNRETMAPSTEGLTAETSERKDSDADDAAKREAEDDAAKLTALRTDVASDEEEAVSEDDIESEELEYFSEDGSDEDSF